MSKTDTSQSVIKGPEIRNVKKENNWIYEQNDKRKTNMLYSNKPPLRQKHTECGGVELV